MHCWFLNKSGHVSRVCRKCYLIFNKRKSFLDISLFTKCFTLAQGSSQQCQSPTAEQWKGIKITARLFAWAKGAGWAPPNQTFTHSSQGGEGKANTSTGNQAPWLTCFPKFYRGMTETNVGLEGERRKQGCSQAIFKFLSLRKDAQLSMSTVARVRSNKVKLQQDEACRKCL